MTGLKMRALLWSKDENANLISSIKLCIYIQDLDSSISWQVCISLALIFLPGLMAHCIVSPSWLRMLNCCGRFLLCLILHGHHSISRHWLYGTKTILEGSPINGMAVAKGGSVIDLQFDLYLTDSNTGVPNIWQTLNTMLSKLAEILPTSYYSQRGLTHQP